MVRLIPVAVKKTYTQSREKTLQTGSCLCNTCLLEGRQGRDPEIDQPDLCLKAQTPSSILSLWLASVLFHQADVKDVPFLEVQETSLEAITRLYVP
jgi:hypothetical protein